MEKYPFIRAWGKMLGSFDYYIEMQKKDAAEDGAPADACYKDSNGSWRRYTELAEQVQKEVERYL